MIPAWIVDPQDHNILLPIGAVREMILEGRTLARGYLNQVSNSWIENPVWTRDDSDDFLGLDGRRRMYKSGDLVQYDSNGRLLFVGRKDDQVKLRGQRIELSKVKEAIRCVLSINLEKILYTSIHTQLFAISSSPLTHILVRSLTNYFL
jgi:non-ribosomal peptide synthetase component F